MYKLRVTRYLSRVRIPLKGVIIEICFYRKHFSENRSRCLQTNKHPPRSKRLSGSFDTVRERFPLRNVLLIANTRIAHDMAVISMQLLSFYAVPWSCHGPRFMVMAHLSLCQDRSSLCIHSYFARTRAFVVNSCHIIIIIIPLYVSLRNTGLLPNSGKM